MILTIIIWKIILLQIFSENIINNPVMIFENITDPFISYSSTYYVIYTPQQIIIFNRMTHKVQGRSNFINYDDSTKKEIYTYSICY